MTVYNINRGIGWASSGVEYAQAYRANLFRNLNIPAKFVFTDCFVQDNLSDLTRNIGFKDDEIIWLYGFFTDLKVAPTTFTLADLEAQYHGNLTRQERNGKVVRFFYDENDTFLTAYLIKEDQDLVHRVEYVSRGSLIRKDYYSYTKMFTEYYAPRDNKAHLYQRRFFNEDGSVAYDELVDGDSRVYRMPDAILNSKEEFIAYFMQKLALQADDVVILDRATETGPGVFRYTKPAKLGVVIHAEHFSENAVTDQTILWNNYYEYQFTNADKVDFFVTATERQKEVLSQQFEQYVGWVPKIVSIPVGSLEQLHRPLQERKPYSIITASRLAAEKHVDWLVRAVIEAKKVIPALNFDIYGAGGESAKINKIIEEGQAQDYIHLKGHRELEEVYQDYELYLSASKSEGFGLTLLEAVGSGLPIIGFDVRYGNQTFISDRNNGYLLPIAETDDESSIVKAFADHLITFFEHKDRQDMREVSYRIAEDYLTTNIEKRWDKLIEEMTKG